MVARFGPNRKKEQYYRVRTIIEQLLTGAAIQIASALDPVQL